MHEHEPATRRIAPPAPNPHPAVPAVDNSRPIALQTRPGEAPAQKEKGEKKNSTVGDGKLLSWCSHSPRTCVPPREAAAAPVDNPAVRLPDGRVIRSRRGLKRLAVRDAIRRWHAALTDASVSDPVPQIVEEAVRVTGGTKDDYWQWMKVANRNINTFMNTLMEFEYDLERPGGNSLRNPRAAFQTRLNRVLPKPTAPNSTPNSRKLKPNPRQLMIDN